jgi:hypothetical protein
MCDECDDGRSVRIKLIACLSAKKLLPTLEMFLLVTVATTSNEVAPGVKSKSRAVQWNQVVQRGGITVEPVVTVSAATIEEGVYLLLSC